MPPDPFAHLDRRRLLAGAACGGLAAALSAAARAAPAGPLVDAATVAALAPTGRLRACINLGNPTLANKAPGGEVAGVSVDMANALAQRLGVGIDLVVVDSALKSVEAVRAGTADVGFFAIDPQRSQGIRFTAPYVLIEGVYLVRQGSALRSNDEVDLPGTTVMVGKGSVYDLYLTRELKAARIERAPTSPSVVDEFLARRADVAAGVKQQLEADTRRRPGLRLLPGRFMVIEQAMGLSSERGDAAHAALRDFVEWTKANAFVLVALERHGIVGAQVAPRSP
jgi:polar amino acid transport system substrate-binding protein